MPIKPDITNASDSLWSVAVERERVIGGHYTKRHKSYAKEFGLSNRGAKGTVISWRGDRPPPVQSRRVAGSRRSGASEHRSQRGGE
jgi:hypothetical protein